MKPDDFGSILRIMKENRHNAYMATVDGDQPRVRPMVPIIEDDMTMWMVTYAASRKVDQIGRNPKVCLTFVHPPTGDHAAIVSGRAVVVDDVEKKRRVWSLSQGIRQYFPGGPESPEFCLMRIEIAEIEWWDDVSGHKVYVPEK